MTIKNVLWGGALGLVVLYVLMLYFDREAIEQDVAKRTVAELEGVGYGWVSVSTQDRGRDVLLTGTAPDEQARAQAISLAEAVWGVRSVDADIDIQPQAEPTPARLSVLIDEQRVTLSGQLASLADIERLRDQVETALPDIRVENQIRLEPDTAVPPWRDSVAALLQHTQGLSDGVLQLAGERLQVEGKVGTSAQRSILLANFQAALGAEFSIENRIEVSSGGDGLPHVSLHGLADGSWVLSGRVPDQASADELVQALDDTFGAPVNTDSLVVDTRVRGAPWLTELPAFIMQLQALDNARISLEDGELNLSGVVQTNDQRRRVLQASAARFGDHLTVNDLLDVSAADQSSTEPAGGTEVTAGQDLGAFCQAEFDRLLAAEAIRFESSSVSLEPISFWLLDAVAGILAQCPENRLRIEGHTDASGRAAKNDALSLGRATSVRDYLISAGVAAQRFEVQGKGSREPIADNATAEGRAMNRRIELRVVGRSN